MATQVDFGDMMDMKVPDGHVLQIKRGDKFIWRRPFKINYDGLVLTRGSTPIGSNNPSDWTEYTAAKKYGYIDEEEHWISDYYRYNEDFTYMLPQGLSVEGYEFLGWLDLDNNVQVADIQKGQFRDFNLSAYFIPTDNIVTFYNFVNHGTNLPIENGISWDETLVRRSQYQNKSNLYVPWGVRTQDVVLKTACPEGKINFVYNEDTSEFKVVSSDGGVNHDVYGDDEQLLNQYQDIVDGWVKTNVLDNVTEYEINGETYTYLDTDQALYTAPSSNMDVYTVYKGEDSSPMQDELDGMIPYEIITYGDEHFSGIKLKEGWYEITCVGSGGYGDAGRK